MNKEVTKSEFLQAEGKMERLLALATKKGGFQFLTAKERKELAQQTEIVRRYEDQNIIIPQPQTLQGIIELKMYEHKLKQKELARMLHTSDTQLSEIIHKKRKPSVKFLKALNQILGIDGNLLLRLV